jgi:hypothetical protein
VGGGGKGQKQEIKFPDVFLCLPSDLLAPNPPSKPNWKTKGRKVGQRRAKRGSDKANGE